MSAKNETRPKRESDTALAKNPMFKLDLHTNYIKRFESIANEL